MLLKRASVKIQSVQANVPASSELRSEAPSSIVEAEMDGLQSEKIDRAEKTEPALDPRSSARASAHLLFPVVKPRVRARLESRADAIQEMASAGITSRSALSKSLTLLAPHSVEVKVLGADRPRALNGLPFDNAVGACTARADMPERPSKIQIMPESTMEVLHKLIRPSSSAGQSATK